MPGSSSVTHFTRFFCLQPRTVSCFRCKREGQGTGPLGRVKSWLILCSVPIPCLFVGTELPPSRQFVCMLPACFLSLRLLMLFIDPFPFYPWAHLSLPYLLVPSLCKCLFHLFRVIFLPPGHEYVFQDFLAVPRVEFKPFLLLFPSQILYCHFLDYTFKREWLLLISICFHYFKCIYNNKT